MDRNMNRKHYVVCCPGVGPETSHRAFMRTEEHRTSDGVIHVTTFTSSTPFDTSRTKVWFEGEPDDVNEQATG